MFILAEGSSLVNSCPDDRYPEVIHVDEKVGLSDTGVFFYFRVHMDGTRLADVT